MGTLETLEGDIDVPPYDQEAKHAIVLLLAKTVRTDCGMFSANLNYSWVVDRAYQLCAFNTIGEEILSCYIKICGYLDVHLQAGHTSVLNLHQLSLALGLSLFGEEFSRKPRNLTKRTQFLPWHSLATKDLVPLQARVKQISSRANELGRD